MPSLRDKANLAKAIELAQTKYPRLKPVMQDSNIEYGTAASPGIHSETYPADESWNPHPGKWTTQIYDRNQSPENLSEAIAGEELHRLGSNRKDSLIDNKYRAMKQASIYAMSPKQMHFNKKMYMKDVHDSGDKRSFNEWMQSSRSDAYIRGRMFPQQNPEWQKPGVYSPLQAKIIDAMKTHLMTPEEK